MPVENKQNIEYGYEVQKLYLEIMLSDAETFVRCQGIFNSELFDKKLQNAAKFINEFVTTNNSLPTFNIVNAAAKIQLDSPGNLTQAHYDWLLSDFETFTRHKGLEQAIIKSADLLEKGEYGAVEQLVKNAVQVGLTKDLGTDYFMDPKSRLMKIKDNNGQLSTGWANLDRVLYGGFNRGELEIFCGGSGAGKSLFLANLGINFALQGLTVVYITLELSEGLVGMRLDSMTTGISTKELFKSIDDVDTKVRLLGKKSGTYQIKYLPSGKTTNDLRSYLKEFEVKTGKKPDVVLVDYLDLLMPNNKKISAENLFIKDKFVSEELRNLAMERKCIMISASQLNRGSTDEVEYDHSHISGGLSKIQTADNVFGIFTSRAMREQGRYQLQFMKTRNSSGVGQKIDLDFNVDTLRITNSDDDDASAMAISRPKDLIKSLQRTTTVNTDEANLPKATSDSTKLRQLLNNFDNGN